MRQDRFWPLFILLFVVGTVAVTGHATFQLTRYLYLSASAPVQECQWEVVQLGGDAFTLKANYSFLADGKEIQGRSQLRNLRIRSSAGAAAACDRAEKAEWKVWYSPKKPQRNGLEHAFPWKSSVYAVLLLATTGYMLFMARFLRRLKNI